MRAGAELKERAARYRERLAALRERSATVDTLAVLVSRDIETTGGLLAGSLAYRLFLWLLPAALVAVAGLGFFGDEEPSGGSRAVSLKAVTAASIRNAAETTERSRWLTLTIGSFLLLLASLALVRALVLVSLLAWGTTPTRRKVRPAGALALIGVAVAAAVAVAISSRLREGPPLQDVVLMSGYVLVWAALWWAASLMLPHGDAPAIRLVPGALLFGVGVQLLFVLTAVYLSRRIAASSALYGALGAAATLQLWLFLLARLIIGSTLLNVVLWERARADRGDPEPHP